MTSGEFERVAREHKDRVHGHAAWLLRDREEARDVAQEALVRLWQHRSDVDEGASRGWLLRTVHNLCLDRHRRRAVRGIVDRDPEEAHVEDPDPGPERRALAAVMGGAIEQALACLGARDRAAVLLREVEGFSYDEIAEILGIPLGTLKASLHRSRERLRASLEKAGVRP
jgi:RNA polymerase sigma-70 factor (ECF subfamily)